MDGQLLTILTNLERMSNLRWASFSDNDLFRIDVRTLSTSPTPTPTSRRFSCNTTKLECVRVGATPKGCKEMNVLSELFKILHAFDSSNFHIYCTSVLYV